MIGHSALRRRIVANTASIDLLAFRDRRGAGEPSKFRRPANDAERRYSLENMVWRRRFTTRDVSEAICGAPSHQLNHFLGSSENHPLITQIAAGVRNAFTGDIASRCLVTGPTAGCPKTDRIA